MSQDETVWRLMREDALMGTITVDEADFPWLRGRFVPERAFEEVKPWFDEVHVIVEAEEFERFDDAYDRIEGALTLLSSSGPVDEFLLHIHEDRAWFRWHDGPSGG
ncbi:hypothetical protein [Streptomyces sp. GSL17-111]|uniref:hypothetical protein n=1 Tax=Streptomyces sp. GSL17-111 TaxID=3121596 RepID=UPI0030F455D5